ncbi:hypothetical protein ABIC78_001004 [Novosphingobium sp. 1529]
MPLVPVVPLAARPVPQVAFDRLELLRILDLYGRMVAAGLWRDYAMDFGREAASFSVFRRTAERPTARIEKRPALRGRQGMWALYGEAGPGAQARARTGRRAFAARTPPAQGGGRLTASRGQCALFWSWDRCCGCRPAPMPRPTAPPTTMKPR